MIRAFDFTLSLLAIIILLPLFIVIAILIKLDSNGTIVYKQQRVGQYEVLFYIFKFRTMYVGADKQGLLTVGMKDSRITRVGQILRRHKLDELPQLINVLLGNMSFVGPRPEVKKYVDLYTEEQKVILKVKPGITDNASLVYFDENQILTNSEHPEAMYINIILPQKILLNKEYAENPTLKKYFKIIVLTVKKILVTIK